MRTAMAPRRRSHGTRPRRAAAQAGHPVFALATLLALAASAGAQGGAGDAPVQVEGTGTWGTGGQMLQANATWTLHADQMIGFLVETTDGTRAVCSHANGTLTRADGSGTKGTCHAEPMDRTIHLEFREETGPGDGPADHGPDNGTSGNQTIWTGTFEGHTFTPLAPRQPPGFSTLGALLFGAALAGAAAAGTLAALYLRERRLTSHLARRLFEKSRGETRKRGEPLPAERVKRILVRSKN